MRRQGVLCGESGFKSGLACGCMTAEGDFSQGGSKAKFQGQDVYGRRSMSNGLDPNVTSMLTQARIVSLIAGDSVHCWDW